MSSPIFAKIRIVPLEQCVAHEGVVNRWVEQIATNLRDEGVMKNPIIVTKLRGAKPARWVVIDGMHRFAALKHLGVPHILVYEIDYRSTDIELAGWDALVFRPFQATKFCKAHAELFKQFDIHVTHDAQHAQDCVTSRSSVLAIGDQSGKFRLITPKRTASVDQCVRMSERIDRTLDEEGYKPVYVANSLSLDDFHQQRATGIVFRPYYSKEEILERTLAGKLFPRKSTRHAIPKRPLRVDVTIPMLSSKISLRAKNELLREHLNWCYASDRMRYYPESVFVFSD